MKDYRAFIQGKMRIIARRELVLDVGGGERFQKWLTEFRPLFNESNYKTFDYDAASGADIVGDIHAMPIPDITYDAVICHSVLEHVRDPLLAMREIRRILKPGGALFLHVPSIYPYHARTGTYPDYWRFFDDSMKLLTEGFKDVEIVKRGGYFTALSFFAPVQHRWRFILDPLSGFLDSVFGMEKRTTTAGYYVYAIKR